MQTNGGFVDNPPVFDESRWPLLAKEYGSRLFKQFRNRKWRAVYRRYGERLSMDYEEVVAWGKWLVSGGLEEGLEVEEEVVDANQFMSKRSAWYDEKRDTYITYISGVPHAIELPGEVHRDIIRAYSNYDGTPASINEIARTFKLPRQWVVKYLRAHEVTHDREPFSAEEVLSRSEDALAEEALQIRRAALYRRLESDKWKEVQKEALKWRECEDNILRPLLTAIRERPKQPIVPHDLPAATTPYAAVVGLSDFHWGKYSDSGENWEGYDRNTARGRLWQATNAALARLHPLGPPDKFYVPIGSDFLHVDNDGSQTAKGTPQDVDGTPAELLVTGCHLMERWIDGLAKVAPVELVLMSGNHDRMLGLAILLYLDALYRDSDRVVVNVDRTPRVYKKYGSNLIGFVHGDGVSKTKDLSGHMAREAADMWSSCPHKTVYTGHLHYERTETDVAFGVTRRQLPSLSGPDRWHARAGYVGAPKAMPVYIHDKERGLVAIVYGTIG